jgi:hypothetical protein
MTVENILKEWLTKHGCDGLCNEDCGCGIDNLYPCDWLNMTDCVAAVHVPCPGNDTRPACLEWGDEKGDTTCPGYYEPKGGTFGEENA